MRGANDGRVRRCWSRRGVLEIGCSTALGVGLESALASRSLASGSPTPRAKSVLFVFLTGGPSHLETFDPKPDAPPEVRGDWKAIATSIPGIFFGEHIPRIAAQAHKLAIVRTMQCHRSLGAHDLATHAILSGVDLPSPGPTRAASRLSQPCFAAGLDSLRPREDGIPSGVHLPLYMADPTIGDYPGQHAGWLGAAHDPMQIRQDPNSEEFHVARCRLPVGMTMDRLRDRFELLHQLQQTHDSFAIREPSDPMSQKQQQAATFLADGRLASAFELDRESDRVRDHYGRHIYGQSLLLARRLIEVGVPIIQVNLATANAQWDTHTDNFENLRRYLLPPFDQSLSALLEDLEASGLLRESLVIVAGEFGRTPKLGGNIGTPFYSPTGRDHWTDCFFALFAGAGIQGGQVVGRSDNIGAFPMTDPFAPSDLGATVYSALGIDPATELRDGLGRPAQLNAGKVIRAVYV